MPQEQQRGQKVNLQGDDATGVSVQRKNLNFIRTVLGSFSSGTATPRDNLGTKTYYGSGSAQRFIRASSRVERFYDTFLPDIYQYIVDYKGCGHFTVYPGIGNFGALNYLAVSGSVVNNLEGNRMKLPFDNTIERIAEGWGDTWYKVEPTTTAADTEAANRLAGLAIQQDIGSPVTSFFAAGWRHCKEIDFSLR